MTLDIAMQSMDNKCLELLKFCNMSQIQLQLDQNFLHGILRQLRLREEF